MADDKSYILCMPVFRHEFYGLSSLLGYNFTRKGALSSLVFTSSTYYSTKLARENYRTEIEKQEIHLCE